MPFLPGPLEKLELLRGAGVPFLWGMTGTPADSRDYFTMQSTCSTNSKGQQERIVSLLKSRGYGNWVERYEFLDLQPRICDFTTRIFELRWERDLNIQCQTRRVDGVTHSSYRLLPGSWRELRGKPESGYSKPQSPISSFSAAKPPKTWEQICAERDATKTEPEPEWSLTP